MDYINKILCGNDLEILPKLPAESVSCVTCSPPYWGLRDYGIEPVIWDGDKNCKHEWVTHERWLHRGSTVSKISDDNSGHLNNQKATTNFCSICGAWRGSLGLEPTFELYIKHLCDIFDEIKRVLRDDGVCFVNIGDSYGGSGNASGHKEHTRNLGYKTLEMGASQGNQKTTRGYEKSLLDIPYRFSIEMTNRGWIKRNTIIWHKPNCMPSSAKDRFTVDFEPVFFFTKSNKALFWTNEKTLECVDKKPLGTKGVEGKDWEWKKQDIWDKTNATSKWSEMKGYLGYSERTHDKESKTTKKKKVSLWTGHDYWFEQQFEEQKLLPNGRLSAGIGKRTNIRSETEEAKKAKVSGWTSGEERYLPQGRNKRAVWTIPTQPFPEAHFAVYPEELIEIPIKAGCPEFICKKCGKARVKIYKDTGEYEICGGNNSITAEQIQKVSPTSTLLTGKRKVRKEIGYSDCGCNAGFESGIVLDPFGGAMTTCVVAKKQQKRYIAIEIKPEYCEMGKKRLAKTPYPTGLLF